MRIKDGFVLRTVAGQHVAIATGSQSKTFHGMVKLNDTGAALWKALARNRSSEELTAVLVEDFGASPAQAAADVADFVGQLQAEGFLA